MRYPHNTWKAEIDFMKGISFRSVGSFLSRIPDVIRDTQIISLPYFSLITNNQITFTSLARIVIPIP